MASDNQYDGRDFPPFSRVAGAQPPVRSGEARQPETSEAFRAAVRKLTRNEQYERDAAQFYDDTGFIAPGKDVPPEMGGESPDVRSGAFRAWLRLRDRLVDAYALDALATAWNGCGRSWTVPYDTGCTRGVDRLYCARGQLCLDCQPKLRAAISSLLSTRETSNG